uniref:PIPO n=1 Tax=Gongylonema pulchrum TaxID=637853 RepID=A0A183E4Z7_9BILA
LLRCGTELRRCCLARIAIRWVWISGALDVFLRNWQPKRLCSRAIRKLIRFSAYSGTLPHSTVYHSGQQAVLLGTV